MNSPRDTAACYISMAATRDPTLEEDAAAELIRLGLELAQDDCRLKGHSESSTNTLMTALSAVWRDRTATPWPLLTIIIAESLSCRNRNTFWEKASDQSHSLLMRERLQRVESHYTGSALSAPAGDTQGVHDPGTPRGKKSSAQRAQEEEGGRLLPTFTPPTESRTSRSQDHLLELETNVAPELTRGWVVERKRLRSSPPAVSSTPLEIAWASGTGQVPLASEYHTTCSALPPIPDCEPARFDQKMQTEAVMTEL